MEVPDVIDVHILSPNLNVGHVWDVLDVKKLRLKYRIVGTFVGCLPCIPFQEHVKGLPLQLSPEEITLLKNIGVIRLVSFSCLSRAPLEIWKECSAKRQDEFYQEQVHWSYSHRVSEIQEKAQQIISGKQKKRNLGDSLEPDQQKFLSEEFGKVQPLSIGSSFIELHISEPCLKFSEKTDAEWKFPSTAQEVLKFVSFKTLWEKGFYLTSGVKFGGDFLAYPGDPLKYHAFYIVVCLHDDVPWSYESLIAAGRLGSHVRKNVLLCSMLHEKFQIQTIKWDAYFQQIE